MAVIIYSVAVGAFLVALYSKFSPIVVYNKPSVDIKVER